MYYDNPTRVYAVEGDLIYLKHLQYRVGDVLVARKLSDPSKPINVNIGSQYYNTIKAFGIDSSARKTYTCKYDYESASATTFYNVERYDGLLQQDTGLTARSLYRFGAPCTALQAPDNSDTFYITTVAYFSVDTVTHLYSGSKSCFNCANPPNLLFSLVNETISDFVVFNNKIYFITEKGLYSSDLDGKNRVTIAAGKVLGVAQNGNKLLWSIDQAIYSANLDGSNKLKINFDYGVCGCAYGFSGSDCQTCSGQVQWFEGYPICASILSNGFPSLCHEHYQCGNYPYTMCYNNAYNQAGQCYCSYGLTGEPLCNRCVNASATITWEQGYPICK